MEEKKKYFMNCNLAGRMYHEADEVWDKLKVGTQVQLYYDKENRYDPNAMAVLYHNEDDGEDYCIGYIPRECNEVLANFFEMGYAGIFECRINRIIPDAHPEHQVFLTVKINKCLSS